MNLPEIAIRQHVLAWMVNAVIVLFGIIAWKDIAVDRFPAIDFPVISVTTTLEGATPETIDATITSVLESRLNSVTGIEHIQSSSAPGVSSIDLAFQLDKDLDAAFSEIQAEVSRTLRRLPDEADAPVVRKKRVGASPVLWMALKGDRTLQQLNQYANNVIKKRLESVPGVGEVRIGGRRARVLRIDLDPERMAAFGVTASDLVQAFGREHVHLPGGFFTSKGAERVMRLDLEAHTVDVLAGMIVAWRDGAPIRARDIGEVSDALEDYRSVASHNGDPSVGIGIVKTSEANTVAFVQAIKQRVEEEVRPTLPPGMRIEYSTDASLSVLEMIASLKEHLVTGTILAAFVVWFFLRSFSATIIVALAIPVSLMGAVSVLQFGGYSLNSISMLGLLLLVGVVVDDAIVVLENIVRQRENGVIDTQEAALRGTRQVVFAVTASSLTLVAIFAPVIFMEGIIARFFESMTVVITLGVLVSLFVSLTLTPMIAARHLGAVHEHWSIYASFERISLWLERHYRRILDFSLRRRGFILLLAAATLIPSALFMQMLGKTFVPEEDEGRFSLRFKAPIGVNIEYTEERLREIEAVLREVPEIEGWFLAVGLGSAGQVNSGRGSIRLIADEDRDRHQKEIMADVRKRLAKIAGVRAFPSAPSAIPGLRGEKLQFSLRGLNLQSVADEAEALRAALQGNPDLGNIDLDLDVELPQMRLSIDRERAAELGISSRDVAETISMLIGGENVARFNEDPGDGERYDIRVKFKTDQLGEADPLTLIWLRSTSGELVRADSVARFENRLAADSIARLDLQYAANFFADPTIPLGEAVTIVKNEATEILSPGHGITFLGQAEEMEKTGSAMIFAFGLALVLVYMVLASQFNSFRQPLYVMLAQPLAVVGGVTALYLTGQTINIYSMIGLILLVGLVAKNAILLIDFTNQRRAEGMDIESALKDACPTRLRPVLMTSITVIFALLPAALGLGAGADTNQPLAISVIGGMITATALTLVVVPAAYAWIESRLN